MNQNFEFLDHDHDLEQEPQIDDNHKKGKRRNGRRSGRKRKNIANENNGTDSRTPSSAKQTGDETGRDAGIDRQEIAGSFRRHHDQDSSRLDNLKTKLCWLRLESSIGRTSERHESNDNDDSNHRHCDDDDDGTTKPAHLNVRLSTAVSPSSSPLPPMDICLVEIQDNSWWKFQEEQYIAAMEDGKKWQKANKADHQDRKERNPYGARVWPPSLALANFLAQYLSSSLESCTGTEQSTPDAPLVAPLPYHYQVLEIGCGTGLASMAAALCGAKVMATDVAPITLKLLEKGWSETCDKQRKHREKLLPTGQQPAEVSELSTCEVVDENLNMGLFDVFSSDPLPWPEPSSAGRNGSARRPHQRILVASAVLYEASLAKALARKCFQACRQDGAWVILADDDTGLREGGREVFETEWDRLSAMMACSDEERNSMKSSWIRTTVEQKAVFGWVDKKVQLLHLNYPKSLSLN